MTNKIKLLVIVLLLPLFIVGQNTFFVDSLEKELKKVTTDTSKLLLLDDLVWENLYSDITKSEKYSTEALKISSAISNRKYFARAHHNIATVFLQKNQNDSAVYHFKRAIDIYQSIGMYEKSAGSYNGIGNAYLYQGIFEKSLENYLKSIRLLENNESNKQKIGLITINIGIVYFNLNNFNKAIEYYQKGLDIANELRDSLTIARCYNNLGNIYKTQTNFAKAEGYFITAAKIFKSNGELYNLANCYCGLGSIQMNKKRYDEAMNYYQKAFDIYKDLKSDDGMAAVYFDFGGLLKIQGRYDEAIKNIENSIRLSRKISSLNRTMEGYDLLHATYAKLNDDKKAYQALKMYVQVRDSMLNKENTENVARLQTIYETEKKEQELIAKDAEIKKNIAELSKKTVQRNAFLFGGIITLLLMIVTFRGYRQKKKANASITRQKEVIEEKQREITDSITYAERIQKAILPPEKVIQDLLPNSFFLYQPKDIVSGDFYWVEQKNNQVFFSAVDCTGHGVPGAFISIIGYNGLNRVINEFQLTQPAQILDKLNNLVEETLRQKNNEVRDGMDIALCSLQYSADKKTAKLQYAGANNPLYIVKNKEIVIIKADKQPIGGTSLSKPFTNHSIQLEKDDLIYIFSDGFADQFGGPKGKKYGYPELRKLLLKINEEEIPQQYLSIKKEYISWKGNLEQIDDVCIIGVRV